MARIRLKSQKQINSIVSNLPGVKGAVRKEADELAAKAEAKLAQHKREGHAKIEVQHGAGDYDQDSLVSLVDTDNDKSEPAAHAIEFGHRARNGRWVPGLYVISGGLNGKGE